MRNLRFIGRVKGFAQRTFDRVDQTPFLPHVPNLKLWRSPVTQDLVKQDLEEFVLVSEHRPTSATLDLAIHKTLELFRLPEKIRPIHLNDVFQQDLDIWTKSPGLPWRDMGYKTKGDIQHDPEAVRRVRKFAHLVKNGDPIHFPDCMAFVRSHVCEEGEYKVRAVWGYPATVTFIEAMFALPMIRAYQKRPYDVRPIAYGFETATGGMRLLTKRMSGPRRHYIGLDFKKFDKTVPPWLIDIAFDILLYNMDLTYYQDYGIADARRLLLLYYAIRKYFIKTTIRTADGFRFQKRSGIASGSYFTQLVGSVCNAILVNWMSLEKFGYFPTDQLYLGDDSMIVSTREWDLDWCQTFLKNIGMELNVAKSDQSTSLSRLKFLGYYINDGIPLKPRSEWLAALLYPERPDRCFDDTQSRALGLYYANMCVDNHFAQICSTIIRFRPFNLSFTSNFERMLRHIGVNISLLDPHNLPDPFYFTKFM